MSGPLVGPRDLPRSGQPDERLPGEPPMIRLVPALSLLLPGCAKGPSPTPQSGPSIAPSHTVFLRNSFDTDPSGYVGRFLPEGEQHLDESMGMSLACSAHIQHRFIEGGNVSYTELLETSSAVTARLGIPLVAGGSGTASGAGQVRVEYTLTGKMLGEISDPVAFNQCCTEQPEQCTTRYIGEFLQGTGAVYHQSERAASVGASAITPQGQGGVEGSHEASWERAVTFPDPVYFAFKTSRTTHRQSTGTDCAGWPAQLPPDPGRWYGVGTHSRSARSETIARNRAMINAMNQAAMAGLVQQQEPEEGELVGEVSVPGGLHAEDWCIERILDGSEERYQAKVLVWAQR